MKNKAIKIGIIATVLPHLFCCVLPVVLAIISLFAPEVAHSSDIIPEWVEPWLFVFSALMLGLSWIFVVRDCHCGCDVCHNTHENHMPQKVILAVITTLFIISVVIHIIAHH